MTTDSPGITVHIKCPAALIEQFGDDVIDPVILIDVDNDTFAYTNDPSGSHFSGELGPEGYAAIGEMLLWTLKLRIRNRTTPIDHSTLELF